MSFDPKRHVIKVQGGREYLPVSGRLVWFRSEHPDWGIVTNAVEINLTPDNNKPPYAIFQATIFNGEGKVMATATKMEDQRGFGDFLEKAETGAVGRALAYCGYGTQFAPELEEGGRFADSPFGSNGGGNRFAGANNRPPMNNSGVNSGNGGNGGGYNTVGNGNGNGANRPAGPAPTPRPTPPPAAEQDQDVFDAPLPPSQERSDSSPSVTAAQRPFGTPPGGITRVREPERDTFDPGGPDDSEDTGDPFAEEDEREAPRTAAPRGAAPSRQEAANPLAGNGCSVDGCTNVLTPGQMTMSMNKFGKALCLLHQRDVAPVGAGGGARRPAAKAAGGNDTLL